MRDPLVLACRWFDRGLAGYLDEDDLREIALTTGDYMSRELGSYALSEPP